MRLLVLAMIVLARSLASVAQPSDSINPELITIIRDRWGVPHVSAPDPQSASYGLAWAMAEDQFHALQTFIAMGQGKLGLLWGAAGLPVDYFRAWAGIEERVQTDFQSVLSVELQGMFSAYAQALNDFARANPKEVRLKSLFPVRPADLVCGGLVIQYAAIGLPDALESIRKGRPDDFMIRPGSLGSNAFAFGASAMDSATTTLLMNPHVPLYGFISLYEAQIQVAGRPPVHGGFVAGLPFPLLAANPQFAWTVTYNWPDLVDIYRLKLRGRRQVELDGQLAILNRRSFRLRFRIAGIPVPIRWRAFDAPQGPVFSWFGPSYALRFPQINPLGAYETWYRLSGCTTVSEARGLFQQWALPTFNFMAVDNQDNISLWYNALIPDRPAGFDWQRVLPGDRSDLIWNHYLPFDSLPQYVNPRCNFLYNTNNSPFCNTCPEEWLDSLHYSRTAGFGWNRENNRALRVRELLFDSLPFNSVRLRHVKWDPCWPSQGAMRGLLTRFQNLDPNCWPALARELSWIRLWNGCGDSLNRYAALPLLAIYFLFQKKDGAVVEIESGIHASDAELITALRRAARHMRRTFGTYDVPLGRVQVIRRNERDYPMSGLPDALQSVFTLLNDRGRLQMTIGEHFTAWVEYRQGQLYRMQTVVPFGSSSRRKSDHYADQTPLFIRGELKPVSFDLDDLRFNASRVYHPDRLTLHP